MGNTPGGGAVTGTTGGATPTGGGTPGPTGGGTPGGGTATDTPGGRVVVLTEGELNNALYYSHKSDSIFVTT